MKLDRNLYRNPDQPNEGTAVAQTINTPSPEVIGLPYDKKTYGTAAFVQPFVAGEGFVTDAGAIDTTKFFFPGSWVPSKTSTGVYKITHNIGDSTKYLLWAMSNPADSSGRMVTVTGQNNNDVTVRIFSQAGAPLDTPFSFVVFQNL